MYLFILSPPRHGSTALYKLLYTSPNVSTFFDKSTWVGEGQFVPGAAKFFEPRWNPDVRWDKIKVAWDKAWDLKKPVLCDKSPSNICRAMAMEEFFGRFAPVYFICLIRSPYARDGLDRWIKCAEFQRQNVQTLARVIPLQYEYFTNNLDKTVKMLLKFLPKLGTLDTKVKKIPGLRGMGERWRHRCGRIRNYNKPNSLSDIREKNRILSKHRDLVEFHGYEVLDV